MGHTVRPRTLADLQALVGRVLGPGEWHEISQHVIDRFADATGDHQWIHVDPARAANGPVGDRRTERTMTVTSVEEVRGGIQVRSTQTIELEGSRKPVVVADAIGRVVLAEDAS